MKPSNSTQTQTKKGKVMENQINSQVQQFYQFWKSAASEQAAFLESFYQELGKAQSSAVAQFNANFDEAVRLGKRRSNRASKSLRNGGSWPSRVPGRPRTRRFPTSGQAKNRSAVGGRPL